MRKITRIYVHCSDSLWGNVNEIRQWHTLPRPKGRGWKDIGYHYLVTNPFPYYASYKDGHPNTRWDGMVFKGRPVAEAGAHVLHDNANTLGVCLVGTDHFTPRQIDATAILCAQLCFEHELTSEYVWGHYEYWKNRGEEPQKSCPNINMSAFRSQVSGLLVEISEGRPQPCRCGD